MNTKKTITATKAPPTDDVEQHFESDLREADNSLQRLLAAVPHVDTYAISEGFGRYMDKVAPLRRPLPRPTVHKDLPTTDERKLTRAIDSLRSRLCIEARSQAERSLKDLVGKLTEEVRACYAWLFLADEDGSVLIPVVTQNTKKRSALHFDDRSIVTKRIAIARAEYISGDISQDEFYLPDTSDTASAIGLPIQWRDNSLLGVVYFESSVPSAFTTAQLLDLRAKVRQLVPPLLSLRYTTSSATRWQGALCHLPWAWDLERLLNRWLHCLTEAAATRDVPGPSVSVWAADWDKDRMWVLATTGYDYEYRWDKTLSTDSFTGKVARSARGKVCHGEPIDLLRCEKVKRMGLREVVAAPIYLPGDQDCGSGAINIYFSQEDIDGHEISDSFIAFLADEVASLAADFHQQKRDLCIAHIKDQLSRSQSPLETLVQEVARCLEAEECSLFAVDDSDERLILLTTTGVLSAERIDADNGQPRQQKPTPLMAYFLHHEADQGFTVYLAKKPGVCVRKNDVPDPDEKGVPDDFPPLPTNKYREEHATSDTDHRRFLGVGMAGDRSRGVIRLIRAATTKPFKKSDEHLLTELAAQCIQPTLDTYVPDVLRQRRMERGSTSLAKAVTLLAKPLANVETSMRRRVNELMQSVVTVFRQELVSQGYGETEVLACFHEFNRRHEDRQLDLYEFHSSTKQEFSRDDDPIAVGNFDQIPARDVVLGRKVLTCDWGGGFFSSAKTSRKCAQAAMPVLAWGAGRLIQGVLSLSIQRAFEWKAEHIELLQHASLGLSATLGAKSSPLFFHAGLDDIGDIFQAFVSQAKEELGTRWCELSHVEDEGFTRSLCFGNGGLGANAEWEPLESAQYEFDDYPISVTSDKSAIRVPLYIGPFQAARLSAGPVDTQFAHDPFMRIGSMCGLWSRFVADLPGGWEAKFKGTDVGSGAMTWAASMRLRMSSSYAGLRE